MNGDKELFEIMNRRRACTEIVSRIERDLDCDILARKLNKISAGRRKKGNKR